MIFLPHYMWAENNNWLKNMKTQKAMKFPWKWAIEKFLKMHILHCCLFGNSITNKTQFFKFCFHML